MYPRLVHVHGPVWIYSYGVMIAVGFLAFIVLALSHPQRKKYLSQDQFFQAVFIGLLGGLCGGRLLYILSDLDSFFEHPLDALLPWIGGFTVLGGIIGALISVSWYLHSQKIPVLPVLDLAALYGPLFHAISRFGCLAAGCCYGAQMSHECWYSVMFTDPASIAPINVPLYPTQIMMSIASFIIFLIIRSAWKKMYVIPGLAIGLFLILENTSRFFLDFWRADRYISYGSLSQCQWFAMICFIVSFIYAGYIVWRHKKQI
jgi:phosphatidylglycerol:prolipoprotein diacylglycerol transferase